MMLKLDEQIKVFHLVVGGWGFGTICFNFLADETD